MDTVDNDGSIDGNSMSDSIEDDGEQPVKQRRKSSFSGLSDSVNVNNELKNGHADVDKNDINKQNEENVQEEWKNITDDFRNACQSLRIGGMVSREGFTLLESMNALELMSPKMDVGMNAGNFRGLEQRIKEGDIHVPVSSFEDLIALNDHLVAMELAYNNGHSLATSIHSCLHLGQESFELLREKAEDLLVQDVVETKKDVLCLVSFGLFSGILKCCGQIWSIVRRADIFEEEDFAPSHHGFPLEKQRSGNDIIELLTLANKTLKKYSSESKDEMRLVELLADILESRTLFLQGLLLIQEADLAGMDAAAHNWHQLLNIWDRCGPGRKIETSNALSKAYSQVKQAFDSGVNRQILGSSPPRAEPVIDLQSAHKEFSTFVSNLLAMCALTSCERLSDMYRGLHRLSERNPCIVVRSLLIPLLYSKDGKALGKYRYQAWLTQNMKEYGIPAHIVAIDSALPFIEVLVKAMYEVLRLLTANRARQRRNLPDILADWGILHQEASMQDQLMFEELYPKDLDKMSPEELKQKLHFCFTAWVQDWTIALMIHHLQLGFELEVYAWHENDIMFWYLQFLINRSIDSKDLLLQYTDRLVLSASQSSAKETAGEKKARKKLLKTLIQHSEENAANQEIVRDNTFMKIECLLAEGMLRIILGLRTQGKMPYPKFEFGSEKIRFNHRLLPYQFTQMPPPLPYESYAQISDLGQYQAVNLFENAAQFFQQAKVQIAAFKKNENLATVDREQLSSLLKVAVTNNVTIMREKNTPADTAGKVVVFDFCHHRYWPVVSVQPKKKREGD